MTMQTKVKGVTLIEILLVMVVIAIIIYASVGYVQQRALQMRIDRTSTQMQQILNAGLSYYVQNGHWPVTSGGSTNLSQLNDYLPPNTKSPWGTDYSITTDADGKLFYVYTYIHVVSATSGSATAAAKTIAGTLPLSYTSSAAGTPPPDASPCSNATPTCYVVSSVNIPGQNLNNASGVNFAGLFKNGACVPVPTCPVSGMSAQIIVSPVQVTGNYEGDSPPGNPEVFPIASFMTYVKGPSANPPQCDSGGAPEACTGGGASGQYWRVCMQVVTERGELTAANSPGWSGYQTMMAVTRCRITNEPSGSGFNVHSD